MPEPPPVGGELQIEVLMTPTILLGDEAVALAAIHSGLTAAYGYPGTPSTEIMEFLLQARAKAGGPHATWCTNEKTAFEQALGTCFAGRRALVSMKHVGLNVAADPFMNSALVNTHGGLVVVVADDPGMHSSQNEQDSRVYADFARIVCLEPSDQQQAYNMTREAFDLSERFGVPVMLRMVTRLAHSRTQIVPRESRPENPIRRAPQRSSWILLPGNARRQWSALVKRQAEFRDWSEATPWNDLTVNPRRRDVGVVTCGIARNYLRENLADMKEPPSHLHIGTYPIPSRLLRRLAEEVEKILVLEDGYPFVESALRGLLPTRKAVAGRMSGELPATGELTPDLVRSALGLPARPLVRLEGLMLPTRPPQLCEGCPHGHAYKALQHALIGIPGAMVMSDIGCYTLGALPPLEVIESCVCMGASIGMAKGAAEAGVHPVVAVIGDSTFLHSGMTPLLDAAAADTPMTLLILDNQTVGMTGAQDTVVSSSRLQEIVLALGVSRDHFHVVDAHPRKVEANSGVLRREIEHRGLSVVIAVRECKVAARRRQRSVAAGNAPPGGPPDPMADAIAGEEVAR